MTGGVGVEHVPPEPSRTGVHHQHQPTGLGQLGQLGRDGGRVVQLVEAPDLHEVVAASDGAEGGMVRGIEAIGEAGLDLVRCGLVQPAQSCGEPSRFGAPHGRQDPQGDAATDVAAYEMGPDAIGEEGRTDGRPGPGMEVGQTDDAHHAGERGDAVQLRFGVALDPGTG